MISVAPEARIQRLSEVASGSVCRIDAVAATADHAARLAGLGITVGRQVRVLRTGDPTVVQVYGSRLGLARALAELVHVDLETSSAATE